MERKTVSSCHTETKANRWRRAKALVECINDHDSSLVTGRLTNNMLVHFPGDESLIGNIVDVKLTECKGFYYMGEML